MEEPVGSENTVKPEEEKHPRNNKLLLALLLVGATAITLFLGIYLGRTSLAPKPSSPMPSVSPTLIPTQATTISPEPTIGWKTYSDPNYKFSISYPPEWKVQGKGDFTYGEYAARVFPSKFSIDDYDKPTLFIGSELVFSTAGGSVCANSKCEETGKLQIKILGKDYETGIKGMYEYPKGSDKMEIVRYRFQFPFNNQITISGNYHTANELETFKKILSTFRFLD